MSEIDPTAVRGFLEKVERAGEIMKRSSDAATHRAGAAFTRAATEFREEIEDDE
ncbi:hypothetical protein HUG10_20580 (plasmid) [Halorarum halophilum]|uniref:Uncharacterized protein n=1 Tax=Halorarum halophilum TaxID=2743090 RepID=A0A7D5GER1_9EURY|nr:hypothetical protein [Halobaculum halophilum]QLG30005.1 hypothetical protein HUG10_20580 [Halobaculum halophilum]